MNYLCWVKNPNPVEGSIIRQWLNPFVATIRLLFFDHYKAPHPMWQELFLYQKFNLAIP